MSELTSKGSPRFRLAQEYYTVPQRQVDVEKKIAECMMGQGKSHSGYQKKRMPLEAPSGNVQQEGVQSAKQSVSVILLH